MSTIKKWYAIIRMALMDYEDKWIKENAGTRGGMKYEKTRVKK